MCFDLQSHFEAAIRASVILRDSFQQVGESFLLPLALSSSNPQATSLALVISRPSIYFVSMTHLQLTLFWPSSSTSQKTSLSLQFFNSFSLAAVMKSRSLLLAITTSSVIGYHSTISEESRILLFCYSFVRVY